MLTGAKQLVRSERVCAPVSTSKRNKYNNLWTGDRIVLMIDTFM